MQFCIKSNFKSYGIMTKKEKRILRVLYDDMDKKLSDGMFSGAALPIVEHYRLVLGDLIGHNQLCLRFN